MKTTSSEGSLSPSQLVCVKIIEFHLRTKFETHSSLEDGDMYKVYLDSSTQQDASQTPDNLLTQDEHLFSSVLDMLGDAMENEDCAGSLDHMFVPLMMFLQETSTKDLVNHVVSIESKNGTISKNIQRLISSMPKMHSYAWMELTLAFMHKLRFHLLSSIDEVSKDEQKTRIRATKDIYDSLPSSFLEGIESLDPPISGNVLKRLNKGKRSFDYYPDYSFLKWSRKYIRDVVCNESSWLVSFQCTGICKYMRRSSHLFPFQLVCGI
jgi:hypothetical protein